MKAYPSLVPLHLQFQVALTEGAVLLISAHTLAEGDKAVAQVLCPSVCERVCVCVCVCTGLSHTELY